jgi:hypothetical protein
MPDPQPLRALSSEQMERLKEIRELNADVAPVQYETPHQFSFPRNNTDFAAPLKNAEVSPEDTELYRKLMKMNMEEYRDEYENDLNSKTQGLGDRISEARGWTGSNARKSVGNMSPYDLARKKTYDNAFRKSSLAALQGYQGLQNTALEKAKAQSQAMGQQAEQQLKQLTAEHAINEANLNLAHKIGLDKSQFDLERKKLRQSFLINLEQASTQRLSVENAYKVAQRQADIQMNKDMNDQGLAERRLTLEQYINNERIRLENEGIHVRRDELDAQIRHLILGEKLSMDEFRQRMDEWQDKKALEWKNMDLKEKQIIFDQNRMERMSELEKQRQEGMLIGNILGGAGSVLGGVAAMKRWW